MRFELVEQGTAAAPADTDDSGSRAPGYFRLYKHSWDDWYTWNTQYRLTYVDAEGEAHAVGLVKIAEVDQSGNRPDLPPVFTQLTAGRFFSVGQASDYYQALKALGPEVRDAALRGLNDIALDGKLWRRVRNLSVTQNSLLRYLSEDTVEGQFRRMARGGDRVSRYTFEYRPPARKSGNSDSLHFDVVPESQPPSNVHVLIGTNGVGKTTVLNNMTLVLAQKAARKSARGEFVFSLADEDEDAAGFANVIFVSFSAFDAVVPVEQKAGGVRYNTSGCGCNVRTARTSPSRRPV